MCAPGYAPSVPASHVLYSKCMRVPDVCVPLAPCPQYLRATCCTLSVCACLMCACPWPRALSTCEPRVVLRVGWEAHLPQQRVHQGEVDVFVHRHQHLVLVLLRRDDVVLTTSSAGINSAPEFYFFLANSNSNSGSGI